MTGAEESTLPAGEVATSPDGERRRWMLMAALSMMFLAAAVLVLVLALRDGDTGSAKVAASAGERTGSAGRERASELAEAVGVEDNPEVPDTTEAPPKTLEVPLEWSAEGLEALPFGTPTDEAIDAVTGALGAAPDDVHDVEMSECTPGTSARWEGDNVQLSMDESGNLASVSFPAALGSVDGETPVDTLGDVRSEFAQVSMEYVPANPDWGEFDDTYRWTVQGTDANASGVVDSEDDWAALEMTWLESERYQGVSCAE